VPTATTSSVRHTAASPTGASVAGDLIEAILRIRRGVRRQIRRDWPHSPLTEAEVELLRLLVDRSGGTRVAEAADALGLAPNTVSTLVRRMVDDGLLVRGADPRDARAARLELTAGARRRIADRRDRRRHTVEQAMSLLDRDQRRAIEAAVPALRALSDLLGES
jgi:DNA-binding MarR family transcriptional regulator